METSYYGSAGRQQTGDTRCHGDEFDGLAHQMEPARMKRQEGQMEGPADDGH